MKKNTLLIIGISIVAIIGSIGWVSTQAVPLIQIHHGANNTENRVRPTVDATHGIVLDISKRLNLSSGQQKQAEQIIDAAQPKMKAIQADKTLSKDEKQMKMGQAMSEMIPKMQAILSPDQKTKFEQLLIEMHGAHGPAMHHE